LNDLNNSLDFQCGKINVQNFPAGNDQQGLTMTFFAKYVFSQPTVLISSNQSTRESVINLQIVIVIVANYKKQVIVLVVYHKNQVIVLIVILKSSDSIIQKQSDSP